MIKIMEYKKYELMWETMRETNPLIRYRNIFIPQEKIRP